jgi:hypothetical protein
MAIKTALHSNRSSYFIGQEYIWTFMHTGATCIHLTSQQWDRCIPYYKTPSLVCHKTLDNKPEHYILNFSTSSDKKTIYIHTYAWFYKIDFFNVAFFNVTLRNPSMLMNVLEFVTFSCCIIFQRASTPWSCQLFLDGSMLVLFLQFTTKNNIALHGLMSLS